MQYLRPSLQGNGDIRRIELKFVEIAHWSIYSQLSLQPEVLSDAEAQQFPTLSSHLSG